MKNWLQNHRFLAGTIFGAILILLLVTACGVAQAQNPIQEALVQVVAEKQFGNLGDHWEVVNVTYIDTSGVQVTRTCITYDGGYDGGVTCDWNAP